MTEGESTGPGPINQESLWASEQLGGLLAILSRTTPEASQTSIRKSLASYLEQAAGGNVLALAGYIQCARSILQDWLDGKTTPRLASLLRAARALNVSVSSFFTQTGPTAIDIATAKQAIAVAGERNVSPSRHADEIRKALLVALTEDVPLSLSDVARRLGYTGTERLYQANRKLCQRIAARYRQSGRSHWWRKPGATKICDPIQLKEILEESLKSLEPTSVHHIAAFLGYANDGYIQQKFPELCAAISNRVAERKRTRLETLHRTLEQALTEHPAPTLTNLSRRLGYTTSTVLRMHEPELCNQLLDRHRSCIEERRSDLRNLAEAALKETPVPSVRIVCRRLGITIWFMNQYFPDVRRRISEQHRRCSLARTERRRDLLFNAIRDIAEQLLSRGLYPSADRIIERIPDGLSREWKTIAAAVRDAQKTLGISK